MSKGRPRLEVSAMWQHLRASDPEVLREMSRERGDNGTDRDVVNMLRHEFSTYDSDPRTTEGDYVSVMNAIATDFPWLAEQVARDITGHERRLPHWVMAKRYAHERGQARQKAGREAARGLTVGDRVIVAWRGRDEEAVLTEVRRSRVKAMLDLGGVHHEIDRRADEVRLVDHK